MPATRLDLPVRARRRETRPTLFCLHALGMSSREFDRMADLLADTFEVVAIDLPGFGDTPVTFGTTVDDMTGFVLDRIREHGATRWLLLGHSMGGKIASLAAARVLDGERGLFGFAGVVLLTASPLEPEPMSEEKRAQMLAWAADKHLSPDEAEDFIDANTANGLDPDAHAIARDDLLRSDPLAWTAWFERGSREERSHEAPILDVPALIVAGGQDGDLGDEAQHRLNGARYPRARFHVVDGGGHLLPLEAPQELADVIRAFWNEVAGTAPEVPTVFAAVLAGHHTARVTRRALAWRALADDPEYRPAVLTERQLRTLRVVADLVVPQPGEGHIDLAARVDAQLAAGAGDGWRGADMPPDAEAYASGLDALASLDEASADDARALLERVAAGDGPSGALTPAQLATWFADCRVDLVKQWLAHPATMARIDYDGVANGGEGTRMQGFQLLRADEREPWEPPAPARDVEGSAA